ncbi:MAG: hypothetical protein LBC56_06180 [Oscillospiraceae bacterium]|jgi:hypothetical protein|nr:hypothetical protein [Oscillospiraceae bacterium]
MNKDILSVIISLTALTISIITFYFNYYRHRYERTPKAKIDLKHELVSYNGNKYVQLTFEVFNVGTKNYYVDKAIAAICKGEVSENNIVFPFLWTYQKACEDCDLYCSVKNDTIVLDYSCAETKEFIYLSKGITYIPPQESCFETLMFTLPEHGVYRITAVVQNKNKIHNDCTCASTIIVYSDFQETNKNRT